MKNKVVIVILTVLIVSQKMYGQSPVPLYDVTPGDGNGLRLWQSDSYKIHMGNSNEYHFGPVSDYSIKNNMSGGINGRGWTWGVAGQTPVAAINILGNMEIAGRFSTGITYIQTPTEADNGYVRSNFGSNIYWDAVNNFWQVNSIGNNDFASIVHSNDNGFAFITSPSNGSFAKTLTNSQFMGLERMRIAANGNVGIGTSNPQTKLDINGSGTVGLNVSGNNSTFVGADINISRISTATGVGQGATLQLNDIGSASYNLIQNSTGGLQFFNNYNNAGWVERMRVAGNGNVGIGTINPDAKLAVKGIIHAEEVRVDLQVPGPDYVFEPTYQLPTLTEIESYIKANKHLPEVPSAKEMEANGINLSEMNMLLLKKVEELTLYVIELKKENEKQNEVIKTLLKK